MTNVVVSFTRTSHSRKLGSIYRIIMPLNLINFLEYPELIPVCFRYLIKSTTRRMYGLFSDTI
jgi:hypothetical protein